MGPYTAGAIASIAFGRPEPAVAAESVEAVPGAGSRIALRTPEGERPVRPGDLIFFPAGEAGAHKLTNTSESENLVYLDFDVVHDLDVTIYPDSGKLGIWGMDTNKIYRLGDDVDYYENE